MNVVYCKKCIITNLKPNILFDKNGICSACLNHQTKSDIFKSSDNRLLQNKFKTIIKRNANPKNRYDVVVGVSGGKDSLYQLIQLKKITDKILAVCVDFGLRTKLGDNNLNLVQEKLNIDLIKFSLKKSSIQKLALYSMKKFGDPDLFSHPLIYNVPPIIAKNFGIKTVVYGEDPRIEYSDTRIKNLNTLINQKFDRNFFDKFVSHSQVNLLSILRKLKIPKKEWEYFIYQDNLRNIKIIFLGSYYKWNSRINYLAAKKIGFKEKVYSEGTYRKYVNVDEDWNRVHHYLKLLKFGYGRCSDHVAEDMRKGYINREEGIKLINKFEYDDLSKYYKSRISKYLGISIRELNKILAKFRNKKIWKKTKNKWVLKYPVI